ncbi:MAG: hypothetical protein ACTSQO_03565 [Candidatus Helarchaeota archaeon]
MSDSLDSYLEDYYTELRTPYRAVISGTIQKSPITHTKCIYFESAILLSKNDKIIGSIPLEHSTTDLFVQIKFNGFKISVNKIRTYLTPFYYEKLTQYDDLDSFKRNLFQQYDVDYIIEAEYLLQNFYHYHVLVNEEFYHLPPPNENEKPIKAKNTVLWISDKIFIDGKPQIELTPYYSDWSY